MAHGPDRPVVSVILPTKHWTEPAETVLTSLGEQDQLLVVCDTQQDSVFERAPDRVEVVSAGDPVGCSGKAHCLLEGMSHAENDTIVWTDDDVSRDQGWLDRLASAAESHEAATEIPVFVGDGAWRLIEPAMVMFGTLGVARGRFVWGGGVAFDQTALDIEKFESELGQTVGDDTLLSQYVSDIWVDTDHPRYIDVGTGVRSICHRLVRFSKAAYLFDRLGTVLLIAMLFVLGAISVAFPVMTMAGCGVLGGIVYWQLQLNRYSWLWLGPSLVLMPFLLVGAIIAPSFRWGGRRYRWTKKFEVTVCRP